LSLLTREREEDTLDDAAENTLSATQPPSVPRRVPYKNQSLINDIANISYHVVTGKKVPQVWRGSKQEREEQ